MTDKYADLRLALDRVKNFDHPDVLNAYRWQSRSGAVRALLIERDELLDICRMFTTWAYQVSERKDVPSGIRSAARQLHHDGTAAIARATGEES